VPTTAPTSWPTDPITKLTLPETAKKERDEFLEAETERLEKLKVEEKKGLSGVWVAFVVIITMCIAASVVAFFISQRQPTPSGSGKQQPGFSNSNPMGQGPSGGPPGSEEL
jgi:hypothetical protein